MHRFNAQSYRLNPKHPSSFWLTLYSVSSCNRMSITVGWTSCGGTSSRGSARRSKPWRTSTGSCWRTSYPPMWPSTFWAATGRTRCVPVIFLVFVCGGLTVYWCMTSPPRMVPPVSRAYFPLLLISVTLSSAVNLWLHSLPSFPLFLHLFHSLNPITFSLLPWPPRRDD